MALALGACDDAETPPGDTPCGSGPAAVALGVGNPFAANPDQRYTLEAGLQGGFHIDVSLRVEGALDPDQVDIELTLQNGSWALSRHITADWLLIVNRDGPSCDYPRARMVLLDEEGGLFPRDRLDELGAMDLRLEIELSSPLGGAEQETALNLEVPPDL